LTDKIEINLEEARSILRRERRKKNGLRWGRNWYKCSQFRFQQGKEKEENRYITVLLYINLSDQLL